MIFSLWQKILTRLPAKVPLRAALIVPLVVQVICMVSIVGYISYAGGKKAITNIADILLDRKSDRFNHDIYDYLRESLPISASTQSLIQQNLIKPEDLTIVQQSLVKSLQHLTRDGNGHAFVINYQGELIATSRENILPKSNKTNISEILPPSQSLLAINSQDRLTRQIARHLSDRFGKLERIEQKYFFKIENDQHEYLVKIFPLSFAQELSPSDNNYTYPQISNHSLSPANLSILQNLNLITVIIIDESNFTNDLHQNTALVILLCGIAAIVAIAIGSITADWIIRPILKLNAAAKQISNIYFVKPKLKTPIQELQELDDGFVEMAEHLESSFESLIDQKLYVSNLLETMPIGVAIHDADGALTYLNESGQNLLQTNSIGSKNLASLNSLNSTFQIYLENTDKPYPVDQLPSSQAIQGRTCYKDDLEIIREGDRVPLEAKAAPIFNLNGKVEGAIVVFRDISDRKNTEKILADYNRKLEQEVQQRTLALQQEIQERQQAELALRQTELELIQANQELARLASMDGLTKIANRRGFDDRLEFEWRRLTREAQPLTLILFDVDYFKLYNDHYGHQLGDRCLEKIAAAIDGIMQRPADMVARYGGEEFVVILPNTNLGGAMLIAAKIHAAIRELAIPHQRSLVSDFITVSLGIDCLIPTVERSPDVLISQADQALYLAKQQGRNCSKVFGITPQ